MTESLLAPPCTILTVFTVYSPPFLLFQAHGYHESVNIYKITFILVLLYHAAAILAVPTRLLSISGDTVMRI